MTDTKITSFCHDPRHATPCPHFEDRICTACVEECDTKYLKPVPANPEPAPKKTKKVRPPSRPDRWREACSNAADAIVPLREALEALNDLRQEYEEWRDNLPENLQGSALGEKLNTVADLDMDSAIGSLDEIEEVVSEAEGADLPRGFGKD